MKIVMIKDDNLVSVDGIGKKIDLSSFNNIHAVVFDTTSNTGHIEYVGSIPANRLITDADFAQEFQIYLDKWDNNEIIQNTVPPIPEYIPTLEEYKLTKIDMLNSQRDIEINKGFSYNNVVYDSDFNARSNVTAQLTAINSGLVTNSFIWRAKNNTNVTFTPQEFTYLVGTMLAYVEAQYITSWTLKDAVMAATTKAEVDNIVWV